MALSDFFEDPYSRYRFGFDTPGFTNLAPTWEGPGPGGTGSIGEPPTSWDFSPGGRGGDSGPAAPGRPRFAFGPVPRFTPPNFNAPSFADAQNEPGYQTRLKAGSDALERSAAARGALRTGGTLKDVLEYGQNFGAQEYSNVYNRALAAYDRRYQGAKDSFAPLLAQWQMSSNAELAAGLAEYQRIMDLLRLNSGGGGGHSGGSDIYDPEPQWHGGGPQGPVY